MQVLGIAAPDETDATGLLDAVADRLADRGSLAVVRAGDVDAPGRTEYTLDDGAWAATGPDASLVDLLDDLARDHDYALVVGFPGARLPQVALGDVETAGDPVYRAPSPDDIDPGELVDWLADAEPYESLESLVARVKRSPEAEFAGAIATFTGRVRARDATDDDETTHLEFEKYEGVAEERLATIREELEARDGVFEVHMHHRTGVIEYGEDIVFVVVLAGHREEGFRTVEDGINRLKDEVPIFKKEITVGDEFWVHDRD